jgi:tripartite-type tricarboxylate transporter receptor subunit TctC
LPKPLVDKLYGEIMRALEAPDVRKRFLTQSAEVIGSSPAQFRKLIESEITTWRDVAKAGGIKPE